MDSRNRSEKCGNLNGLVYCDGMLMLEVNMGGHISEFGADNHGVHMAVNRP